MSYYMFSPSPDLSTKEETYATWDGLLSEFEISRLRVLGDSLVKEQATLAGNQIEKKIRDAEVSWITQTEQSFWLYDKLAWVSRQINGKFFEFDISGFCEDFQYTVYSGDGGHYDWHMDKGLTGNGFPPRKFSLVMQLSDPSEYEGGDLELMFGGQAIAVQKKQGLIYAFPSWILHRVTPVTKGTRRSLVVWIAGPKFK